MLKCQKLPATSGKKEKCVQNVFPLYRNDGDDDNNNIYPSMINIHYLRVKHYMTSSVY